MAKRISNDIYVLADRMGHGMASRRFPIIEAMIREGQIFRSERLSKNGGPQQPASRFPEFEELFKELMPTNFLEQGLRDTPDMAGEVDTQGIASLFARIYRERRTGRLFLRDAGSAREKVVVFSSGVPINAFSDDRKEALGEVLIGQGLLTEEGFAQVAREAGGRRLGSTLVQLERVSEKQVRRALSVQAMERIINIFRQGESSFRFVYDPSADQADVLLVAGPRDLIEIGLSAALSANAITEIFAAYGDPVFRVEIPTELAGDLTAVDHSILQVLSQGHPLSLSLPQISRAVSLTTAEARSRVLTLMRFGVLLTSDANVERFETTLQTLQTLDYFALLEVRRAVSAHDLESARLAAINRHIPEPEGAETPAASQARARIEALIDKATTVLGDKEERDLYQRALQLGLDYGQDSVRERLLHEHYNGQGRSLLKVQDYEGAQAAFRRAAEIIPGDPDVYVDIGWAAFLGSDRGAVAGAAAIREMQRALAIDPNRDAVHLTLGKIHRLLGETDAAEQSLRRAIELSPGNNEAQSELRLLFTRQIDQGRKGGAKGKRLVTGSGSMLPAAFAYVFLVFGLLYAGANLVPGGVDEWPEISVGMHAERLDEADEELDGLKAEFKAAQDALNPETMDRTVPEAKRVMGNVEYHHLPDDMWFWMRRVLLLVAGLLGLLLVRREKLGPVALAGENPTWLMIALPYALLAGFISPSPLTSTALGPIIGMSILHVIAEQTFFSAFLGRLLIKKLDNPGLGAALTAILYGVYQLTFFAPWQSSGMVMVQDLMLMSAFGGGAYALLLWKSGGMLAPVVAHFVLYTTMMIRAVMAQG